MAWTGEARLSTISGATPQGFSLQNTTTATPGTASDTLGIADQFVVTSGTTPTAPTGSGANALWCGVCLAFT